MSIRRFEYPQPLNLKKQENLGFAHEKERFKPELASESNFLVR
jgi:hypothetical protein